MFFWPCAPTGNRVFGAMKGACDGGLHIPHSNKRFPGFTKGEDGADDSYNPEVHRARIYGLHVAEYMRTLKEEDPERYQLQFSAYIRNKIDPDSIEKMYEEAFQKIRANPDPVKKEAREVKRVRQGAMIKTAKSQYVRNVKLDKETRKQRVLKKVSILATSIRPYPLSPHIPCSLFVNELLCQFAFACRSKWSRTRWLKRSNRLSRNIVNNNARSTHWLSALYVVTNSQLLFIFNAVSGFRLRGSKTQLYTFRPNTT